ncbi:MAG: hypothetical protein JO159_00990 [Acidobacteria bacterium]|nr:hypothetical protein [Acidobacteriota bacterium]MBV9624057.1 hypothetical protein [Acidobacteriota bacterium]
MNMTFIKTLKNKRISGLVLLTMLTLVLAPCEAQSQSGILPGHFRFTTFAVPNQFELGVEQINNYGLIVGQYRSTLAPLGPFRGFERFPNGKLQTLIDPLDVEGPTDPFGGDTEANGVDDRGVIVGQYWDTAALHYAGFFLYKGKYTTYNVPGFFNTTVDAINDEVTDFCGFVQAGPPSFFTSAFVSDRGTVTVFTVPNATRTEALAINNFDQVVGVYTDASGVLHGFTRDREGHLFYPLDVPGATTAPNFGTYPLGINDFGFISGHFFDSSNNEHGFVRAPWGQFFQIDVPGAAQTAGGGLNDLGTVVGHWVDQNGNQIGYIATPSF